MTDDFDRMFGSHPQRRPSFAERVGGAPPEPPSAATGDGAVSASPYRAYGFLPAGVGEACEVASWVDGTDIPDGIEFQYRLLMDVGFTGRNETELRIHLPACIVLVQGQMLRELRKKLARHTVTFVQQWNPKVWKERPPEGEPFIERIRIIRNVADAE